MNIYNFVRYISCPFLGQDEAFWSINDAEPACQVYYKRRFGSGYWPNSDPGLCTLNEVRYLKFYWIKI